MTTHYYTMQTTSDKLSKKGFQEIGDGNFSKVYSHGAMPGKVIKVTNPIDMTRTLTIYKVLQKLGQINPHFPKIYTIKAKENEIWVVMEKLDEFNVYDRAHVLSGYLEQIWDMPGRKVNSTLKSNYECAANGLFYKYSMVTNLYNYKWKKSLSKAVSMIVSAMKNKPLSYRDLDMHEGNVMLRGNVPVITDPYIT